MWVSKLQTEIALRTTKAEYIALSYAMRSVIPTVNLIKELTASMSIEKKTQMVKCTLFEDNNGALELATVLKMRPRTKHIALKYHHFRSFVKCGYVNVSRVDTVEQLGNIFTNPLPDTTFRYLRKKLLG